MLYRRRALQLLPALVLLAGCAAVPGRDPVQVTVAGVEALPGEGLEWRFLCKLRVQNPNDQPIEFNGVFVELQVRGTTVASGVSDAAGVVPRFGEVLMEIPVTASALRIARTAITMYMSDDRGPIAYVLKGKIAGPAFAAVRFESKGEIELPEMGGRKAAP